MGEIYPEVSIMHDELDHKRENIIARVDPTPKKTAKITYKNDPWDLVEKVTRRAITRANHKRRIALSHKK
jgi:hypothetical protein